MFVFVDADGGNGGPQNSLLAAAGAVSRAGHQVRLCCPDGWLSSKASTEFPVDLLGPKDGTAAGRIGMALRFAKIAKDYRCVEAVVANGVSALHIVGPTARVRGWATKLVFRDSRLTLRAALGLRAWATTLRALDVAAVSGFSLGLVHAVVGRGIVLPNAVSISPGEARQGSPGVLRGAYVGSGDPNKRFDLFARVAELTPHISWKVYGVRPGSSDYVNSICERLSSESHVQFVGRLDGLAGIWSDLDVVLIPSMRESFSRVAVEAMGRGVLVVASDVPGMREVVIDNLTGLTFPAGDAIGACSALERLATDSALRSLLVKEGMSFARRFEPEVIAPQVIAFLERRSNGAI